MVVVVEGAEAFVAHYYHAEAHGYLLNGQGDELLFLKFVYHSE